MANISTSNITQKWADNGYWNSETDRTIYAGYATSTNINYVTRIRILMPGNGVSAQFKIAYKHDGSLNGKQLKYKITKEEQDGTYGRANASTAGDGTLTIAASSGFFTINYTGSFTAGSYLYIYLWTGGSTSVYTLCNILGPSNHTATYTEGTASDCAISGSTIGSAVNFTISADNSSFTHTITASFGSYVYNIATKTASKSVTWTPPLADLAGLIPNGVEITGSVTCSTYNGSTFIGSNTYNLKLSLPASVVPTLDASKISVSPVSNNAAANSWGAYVQNYSMAKATVASGAAAGVYGSTIKKTELVYAGHAFASLQTGILTTAGNVTFTVRVTDSRGRTASVGFSAYINPYIEPYLAAYTVYRCNAQGVQSNDGMYVYASATPIWSSVNGKNSVTLTVEVRNVADNSIATFTMDAYTDIISAGLSPNSTYRVTITIRDILGNYNDSQIALPATSVVDFTIMKGHVKKAALFKYPERDGFEVPGNIWGETVYAGTYSLEKPIQVGPTLEDSSFAPAGYGLGQIVPETVITSAAQIDSIEREGVYQFNAPTAGDGIVVAGHTLQWGVISYKPYNLYAGALTFESTQYPNVELRRNKSSGLWGEWEWINPPMAPNVEYRTTERHNGKVVYKKLVGFGALPNNTEKSVTAMPTNTSLIEAVGYGSGSSYNVPIPGYYGIQSIGSTRSSGALWISTTIDMTSYNGWITIKYTK